MRRLHFTHFIQQSARQQATFDFHMPNCCFRPGFLPCSQHILTLKEMLSTPHFSGSLQQPPSQSEKWHHTHMFPSFIVLLKAAHTLLCSLLTTDSCRTPDVTCSKSQDSESLSYLAKLQVQVWLSDPLLWNHWITWSECLAQNA